MDDCKGNGGLFFFVFVDFFFFVSLFLFLPLVPFLSFSGDYVRFRLVFGLYLDEKAQQRADRHVHYSAHTGPETSFTRRKKQKRSITIDTKSSHPEHPVSCYTATTTTAPSLVTITGIRFPADGSKPHLVSLTTTTDGVEDGPDCFWGHIPDFRDFWKTPQAWQWRDVETFRLEKRPLDNCNGLYVLFYSFDLESLPENRNFPVSL